MSPAFGGAPVDQDQTLAHPEAPIHGSLIKLMPCRHVELLWNTGAAAGQTGIAPTQF